MKCKYEYAHFRIHSMTIAMCDNINAMLSLLDHVGYGIKFKTLMSLYFEKTLQVEGQLN